MMVRIIGRWNRELKRLEGKTKQHPEYVPLEELATNEVTAKLKVCPECERELQEEYTRCWSCESWSTQGREI